MFGIVALVLLTHQPLPPVMQGVASFYTESAKLKVTASGELFDDQALTCAMEEGVFGDYYQIVSESGKSVVCRLNDRGPFVKGRVVDLSKAAIRTLDPEADLLKVRVYHFGKNPPKWSPTPAKP